MFGLPDYKTVVQHNDQKIYFGDVALVNQYADGKYDGYDWLDIPAMVEFVLNELMPEHPDYEPVPCFYAQPAAMAAFESEAGRLCALQQAAKRGDAEAAAKLKSIKEALLLIARGSAKRKRF